MKIYTRKGDKGETGLRNSTRISKGALRMECLGTIDELSACLGLARELFEQQPTRAKRASHLRASLIRIQGHLFELGAELAAPGGKRRVAPRWITWLEHEIDGWSAELPALRSFILQGGGPAGACLHLARTICRRAERNLVRLSQLEPVEPTSQVYLNRLSDALFTAARYAAKLGGFAERLASNGKPVSVGKPNPG